jgi:hypothetical protein
VKHSLEMDTVVGDLVVTIAQIKNGLEDTIKVLGDSHKFAKDAKEKEVDALF